MPAVPSNAAQERQQQRKPEPGARKIKRAFRKHGREAREKVLQQRHRGRVGLRKQIQFGVLAELQRAVRVQGFGQGAPQPKLIPDAHELVFGEYKKQRGQPEVDRHLRREDFGFDEFSKLVPPDHPHRGDCDQRGAGGDGKHPPCSQGVERIERVQNEHYAERRHRQRGFEPLPEQRCGGQRAQREQHKRDQYGTHTALLCF